MKKITILLAIFVCALINAQATLNGDWYVQKITLDGVDYTPQNVESIARLTYDTGWEDMNTQVCMQRSYNMTNLTATQYGVFQYSGIAGTCASPATTDFQTKYFTAFHKAVNAKHNYLVTGTGTNKVLTITTSLGDMLIYGTQNILGVNDVASKSFAVYPNPTKDVINIVGNGSKMKSASIYDLSGKMVISETSNAQINVSSLKKGIYILQVSSENETKKIKIIKE